MPWVEKVTSEDDIFRQDVVLVYTRCMVQNLVSTNICFGQKILPTLPNSPNLNPLDYYVSSIVE